MTIIVFIAGLFHVATLYATDSVQRSYGYKNAAKFNFRLIVPSGIIYLVVVGMAYVMLGFNWSLVPNAAYALFAATYLKKNFKGFREYLSSDNEFDLPLEQSNKLRSLGWLAFVPLGLTLVAFEISGR